MIDNKNYEAKKKELQTKVDEFEALRGTEAAKAGGSERERLKNLMQPLNDLRGEIDAYEIQQGMRPEGAFVTVKEIR